MSIEYDIDVHYRIPTWAGVSCFVIVWLRAAPGTTLLGRNLFCSAQLPHVAAISSATPFLTLPKPGPRLCAFRCLQLVCSSLFAVLLHGLLV